MQQKKRVALLGIAAVALIFASFALVACDSGNSSDSGAAESSSSVAAQSSGSSSNGMDSSDTSTALSSSDIAKSSSSVVACTNTYGTNTVTDCRDGQVYKTVTIGTQTWMAENLNYDPGDVSSMGSYAWSGCYNDTASNCTTYGRLYTWEVAMNNAACAYGKKCSPSGVTHGVCPAGWHLPTKNEFTKLYNTVGGDSTASTKLEFTSGWYNGYNGTDDYGFSVLPAGLRSYDGFFDYQGKSANLWSASVHNASDAWRECFNYSYASVSRYHVNKGYAISVRCLKDDGVSLASSSSVANSNAASSSSKVVSSSNSLGVTGSFTDSRDGQVYKTVTIGTQTWMAENLIYDPGDDVSDMSDYAWSGCYDNVVSNCTTYGRLYTWDVAMNNADCADGKMCSPSGVTQGVCPAGWHLPTMDEFDTLYNTIGGTSTAGTKLKSTSEWWWYNDGYGTDDYGFSVLSAGSKYKDGNFNSQGYYAVLWSASGYNELKAWNEYFKYSDAGVSSGYHDKDDACSVRCVQD
ncbi:MAG: fibrobacter succinogenes major paralogous domain-containing protein [Sphaerochaetaceae bacterium]